MKVSVYRDSRLLGEFVEEQIRPGIRSGMFRPTDFYRASGMVEKRPLNDFLGDGDMVSGIPKGKKRSRQSGIEVSSETYQLIVWVISLPFTLGLIWLFWYVIREWLVPFFTP